MPSLAEQLAQSASLNSALLADRSRRKATESYLFTGREADSYDLEATHALAMNGLLQLTSLNPLFQSYEDILFSEQIKAMDRTMLGAEASTSLDKDISAFLLTLGPFLMESPTQKVIEWLVRRLRVHEFNLEALLGLFLPYHESPHFAKMVTILHIKPNTVWSFLLPYRSAGQNLSRTALVTEMLKNSDLARFVTSLLPNALENGASHRTLIAFNAATLHDFINRKKRLDEGTLAYLLPALLDPLNRRSHNQEEVLGSYILFATLSQKCSISTQALAVIVDAMTSCASRVSSQQYLKALVAVCEAQNELDVLSTKTVKRMLRLPDFLTDLVSAAVTWSGVPKILAPLIEHLAQRLDDDAALNFLKSVIQTPNVPVDLTRRLARVLLHRALESPDTLTRELLADTQQRHPAELDSAMNELIGADEELQDSLQNLVISLSVRPSASTSKDLDVILGSANADPLVRRASINKIIALLSSEVPSPDSDDLEAALAARIQDSDLSVLEALYAEPGVLTQILAKDPEAHISTFGHLLHGSGTKAKKAVVRLHLTFLANHFCDAISPTLARAVVYKVFFPLLLFTKSRQRTVDTVWDVIAERIQANPKGGFEIMAGCVEIVKAEREGDPVETMSSVNAGVSERFAGNILASNEFKDHLSLLLSNLSSTDPYAYGLSYLIAQALLGRLSGEHKIEVATQLVDLLLVSNSSGPDSVVDISVLDSNIVGRSVVAKPTHKNTLRLLKISLLSAIALSIPSGGAVFNAFDVASDGRDDTRGHTTLLRSTYTLANMFGFPSNAPIYQALFSSLSTDALAFLAGIWADCGKPNEDRMKAVALQHGVAYLTAQIAQNSDVDFQTIVPAILIACQSSDDQCRHLVFDLLSLIREVAQKQFTSVYRFDTIYGASDRTLQYLDQDDLKRYLDALLAQREHFKDDPQFLKTFHHSHLAPLRGEKKKGAEYKHRVLCHLFSHANALPLPAAQISLLRSIDGIPDRSRAQILLPTLEALLASNSADSLLAELAYYVLESFDETVVAELNENKNRLWDAFDRALRRYFQPECPSSPRTRIASALERGLFSLLNIERKEAVCEVLLDIGTRDHDTQRYCKSLLAKLVSQVPLIVRLLNALQPGSTTRPSKRTKLSDPPVDVFPRLGLLIEVLVSISLPGSLELITKLLDTLNGVIQATSSTEVDVSYIEHMLMSTIENVANKIQALPNLSPSAIRLDVLVELIRVADNPQTFHQALLLISTLAHLAPDSALHNVMPVFTFMGSNVFHRDDSYSFKVVQQTVDSIVPVMVSSLKREHLQTLDLYLGSKDFLRVFTDAAQHIPRHRRNNFFSHLVDVLGPEDFLAPVCMLMVEKASNRVVKQPAEEVAASFALPSAILHAHSAKLQVRSLVEVLREAQRLVRRIQNPQNEEPTFLAGVSDEKHSIPLSSVFRRRARALVMFVGFAMKSAATPPGAPAKNSDDVGALVLALITMSALVDEFADVSQSARVSLMQVLDVISPGNLLAAVNSMASSSDLTIKAAALNLLGERIAKIPKDVRQTALPTITQMLETIQKTIMSDPEELVSAALQALRSVAISLQPGEEGPVAKVLPVVLAATKKKGLTGKAVAALSPLPTKLGPRIIPHFREIIDRCVAILARGDNDTLSATVETLQGLLISIPTFWSVGDMVKVLDVYLQRNDPISGGSSDLSTFIKSVTKKAPPEILLPALIEIWATSKDSPDVELLSGYFHLLSRTLRGAPRPVVLEHLRVLFGIFLDGMDLVKAESEFMESNLILAFRQVVVKLNEAAFRPLFRRLYDWAFVGEGATTPRQVVFCHLYLDLLGFFNALMNPYMSFLLPPFTGLLEQSRDTAPPFDLWLGVIEIITKSLVVDDGAFWRDEKLRQIAAPIIAQVSVSVDLNQPAGKLQVQECVNALVDSATDDTMLKSINLNLLMHTRSEDARLRLFALTCSESIWQAHGGKLLGFTAETATFISECSEDENDSVVKATLKLKNAVESVAGNIEG